MIGQRYLEPFLDAVRVVDVRSYLLSKGWRITPFPRPEMIRFEGPDDDEGQPIVQLVPASERLRDFRTRLAELIDALSAIEDRPPDEILRNIVTPTCDILHVRLETSAMRTGTMALGFAPTFIENLRNLLVFAACGELRPSSYFQRALKQGVAFANKCRIAATQTGSFVAVVQAPVVPPANQEQVTLKAYPWERRVMTRLAEGLALVEQAVASGKTDRILDERHPRISGNMCEAILGLRPEGTDASIEIGVSWSHAWPVEPETPQQPLCYAGRSFEQIEAIARALRMGIEPQKRELRGRVVKLAADDPLHDDEGSLNAALRVETADAPSTVHLLLSRNAYRTACDAHRDGRMVKTMGVLDRRGRRWVLSEVADFEMVVQEPEQ